MCCGQKRTELRNSQTQRTSPSVPLYGAGNSPAQAVRTQSRTPPVMQTVSPVNKQIRSVQPQAMTATSMQHSSISVRYQENSPVRVRGLVSGMCYEFSGSNPVQKVDARDASSLLSTRFFRRA
jgi:hypothetical protein